MFFLVRVIYNKHRYTGQFFFSSSKPLHFPAAVFVISVVCTRIYTACNVGGGGQKRIVIFSNGIAWSIFLTSNISQANHNSTVHASRRRSNFAWKQTVFRLNFDVYRHRSGPTTVGSIPVKRMKYKSSCIERLLDISKSHRCRYGNTWKSRIKNRVCYGKKELPCMLLNKKNKSVILRWITIISETHKYNNSNNIK